jgi:hypothetical protein
MSSRAARSWSISEMAIVTYSVSSSLRPRMSERCQERFAVFPADDAQQAGGLLLHDSR